MTYLDVLSKPANDPNISAWLGVSVDDLIKDLESRGLGWSLDNTGRLIEARVWDWPYVIGRYRPYNVEPLAKMLSEAMYQVDWTKYPVIAPNDQAQRRPDNAAPSATKGNEYERA